MHLFMFVFTLYFALGTPCTPIGPVTFPNTAPWVPWIPTRPRARSIPSSLGWCLADRLFLLLGP